MRYTKQEAAVCRRVAGACLSDVDLWGPRLGQGAADGDEIVGDDAEAYPALHAGVALVAAAVEAVAPFDHADAALAPGAPRLTLAKPALFLLASEERWIPALATLGRDDELRMRREP